jgi:murein DD-endopeptidase MepM/ murein hydrolase activator NlpD
MTVIALVVATSICPAVTAPVDGPIVGRFEPIGRYSGHWGVDYATPVGSEVAAVAAGVVSFAGSVAGRRSVSIDHGRGLVTTVSYLDEVLVPTGAFVERGDPIALSGLAHDVAAVHLSLRIDGIYVDPFFLFRCRVGDISDALSLVPSEL